MNCEQIKELLSAFLDDMLASAERQAVLQHLSTCDACRAVLADYRRFDSLLAQLPRVSPDAALHDRIFSSPAYQELLLASPDSADSAFPPHRRGDAQTRLHPYVRAQRSSQHHPHLVALPGGRAPSATTRHATALPPPPVRRRSHWLQRTMLAMIAATLFLTIGIVGLIGWNMWQHHATTTALPGAIPPPADLQQNGPLPAGTRFTFLRDGALWSAASDGSKGTIRLTSSDVTVAPAWAIRTPLPGRTAGNVLAYIDLQHAAVHTIRSDRQNDTTIPQPLLKTGISPSSIWDTSTGAAILSGLSWSQDGNTLAFMADPTGSGAPGLYLYSLDTGNVHAVPLPSKGSVSQPTWSPDGTRIAFVLTHNGTTSVLDYNTQNHGLLTIAASVATKAYAKDTVLKLAWGDTSPAPTITWSVGVIGHVHTLWSQQVGMGGGMQPRLLASGDFVEATLNQASKNTIVAWVLVADQAGLPGDAFRVDLLGNMLKLTGGKQVSLAQWSPDGTYIGYFDALSSGTGTFHTLNISTGSDTLVASHVVTNPAPAWSQDTQRVAYSTGAHVFVTTIPASNVSRQLKLQGSASALSWSPSSPAQLVVALSDGAPGIYLVDSQRNSSRQVDSNTCRSSILWTQIP